MVEQSELNTSWSMVTSAEELDRAADALAGGHGPIGVDAERASGYTYRSNAYLVQASRRGSGTFLFDPTEITDFSALSDAIGDEEWIFHAASQDLACLAEIGLLPSRIFDTELATRLLGFDRVGLGAVVERLLGISLKKAHSAADWSTRPLPESWLEYAALDVALLPDLRDAVAAELAEQEKEAIAFEEFEAVRTKAPKAPATEPWRKLAGGGRLSGQRSLAIARELWTARDSLARERDVAPGRLFPDASLIAAVKANPRSQGELAAMKAFHGGGTTGRLNRRIDELRAVFGYGSAQTVGSTVGSDGVDRPMRLPELLAPLVTQNADKILAALDPVVTRTVALFDGNVDRVHVEVILRQLLEAERERGPKVRRGHGRLDSRAKHRSRTVLERATQHGDASWLLAPVPASQGGHRAALIAGTGIAEPGHSDQGHTDQRHTEMRGQN